GIAAGEPSEGDVIVAHLHHRGGGRDVRGWIPTLDGADGGEAIAAAAVLGKKILGVTKGELVAVGALVFEFRDDQVVHRDAVVEIQAGVVVEHVGGVVD